MHQDHEAATDHRDDETEGVFARLRRGASITLGALLAFGIVGGGALWVVRLNARDASELPIIRAAAGPVKERPDDPGGAETPYRDIRSYEIAEATPPSRKSRLAPPPERPAEEDLALGVLSAQPGAGNSAEDIYDGVDRALAPRPRPDGLVPSDGGTETDDAGELDASATGNDSGPAPNRSPRYRVRPKDLGKRFAAASATGQSEEERLREAALASPVLIQLGAFPDEAFTRREWQKIYRTNGDILAGRVLVLQTTVSGGQTFYRMRAGPFRSRSEANSICQALKARNQDCLVATNLAAKG